MNDRFWPHFDALFTALWANFSQKVLCYFLHYALCYFFSALHFFQSHNATHQHCRKCFLLVSVFHIAVVMVFKRRLDEFLVCFTLHRVEGVCRELHVQARAGAGTLWPVTLCSLINFFSFFSPPFFSWYQVSIAIFGSITPISTKSRSFPETKRRRRIFSIFESMIFF